MHARAARGRIGRIVASVNPLMPKPGTAYQWLPMEAPASIDRQDQAAAGADRRESTTCTSPQVRTALVLPGAAVAGRPARRGRHRDRRAQRRTWRAAIAEAGLDPDFYVLRDRSPRRRAAVGHHRRRHEDGVLSAPSTRRASGPSGRSRPGAPLPRTSACCRRPRCPRVATRRSRTAGHAECRSHLRDGAPPRGALNARDALPQRVAALTDPALEDVSGVRSARHA